MRFVRIKNLQHPRYPQIPVYGRILFKDGKNLFLLLSHDLGLGESATVPETDTEPADQDKIPLGQLQGLTGMSLGQMVPELG